MSNILSKSSILKKTIEIGGSTLVSRFLGIAREMLMAMYLGAGVGSDAFLTAYKIPNTLRKVFAEGALSAAFIPTLVQVSRNQGKNSVNSLMSLAFLVFEATLLAFCGLVMWKAEAVLGFIAPGFSSETVAVAAPLLRILMPFIFFLSSSALLAGALQSVGHFFVPAFSPILLNIFFITGLMVSWSYKLSTHYLCFFILAGGLVQLIGHIIAYHRLGFSFKAIDSIALKNFGSVLSKFVFGSASMSMIEITLFIDTTFASYLPAGSISLIHYANRFMGIPLGVFAVAFSTILLPHFSRITAYAPKRLSFYLLETTKFIFWVTIPATIAMGMLSEKIFHTIFMSDKFKHAQVIEASHILMAFLIGLFFFSLNKIVLNMYYALNATWIPAVISGVATAANIGLNFLFINYLQATGLALATSISGIIQTVLFVYLLHKRFNFKLYGKAFLEFLVRYTLQLLLLGAAACTLYYGMELLIITQASPTMQKFLLHGMGFWLWVAPLGGFTALAIFYTRKLFRVHLYFLD